MTQNSPNQHRRGVEGWDSQIECHRFTGVQGETVFIDQLAEGVHEPSLNATDDARIECCICEDQSVPLFRDQRRRREVVDADPRAAAAGDGFRIAPAVTINTPIRIAAALCLVKSARRFMVSSPLS